jgi:hypothetical protein
MRSCSSFFVLDANHICMIASPFNDKVIPGGPEKVGREPESSKIAENQIIVDPPPKAAGDDEYDSTNRGRVRCV